jgi:Tfp pilus assembly protein PilE
MNTISQGEISFARFNKLEARLASSEKTGFAGKVNQLGINMVDLMMWLVIAALLLAAALQGIGFYQKAAWNYQLESDVSAVRTFMEAQYTLQNNTYPTQAQVDAAITAKDLKLTSSNGSANTISGVTATATGGWTATVCSGALAKATGVKTNAAISITSATDAETKANCP